MNRSKLLPIHQFPCLIDEVARLKELAKREASATYRQAGDEFGYECAMLNAAPKLLEVLGEIRAGDAHAISEILALLEEIADISEGDRELLTRYRDMAQAMEATR